ncbi:MAG: hypothetical protein KDA89_18450, partial [Planctomycetaceae bacterium]|nr:hypothetical protein [Planctomycetaceae bacterium]
MSRRSQRSTEQLEPRTLLTELIVSTTADEIDGQTGTGELSLREAVMIANNTPGPDLITFYVSGPTLDPSLGHILITDDVTIRGNFVNTTISGGDATRILQVGTASGLSLNHLPDVIIEGLTLDRGDAGAENGGAILNYGNTRFESGTVFGSKAANGGAIYNGHVLSSPGGERVSGTLNLTNAGFDGNGSPEGQGGAIYTEGDLSVDSVTFDGNYADAGAAIYVNSSPGIGIADSTFSNNTATTYGGAVYTSGSILDVTNSRFTRNAAGTFIGTGNPDPGTTPQGGAIYSFRSRVNVTESFFSENLAQIKVSHPGATRDDGNGGAIAAVASQLDVSRSTFDINFAVSRGGAIYTVAFIAGPIVAGGAAEISSSTFWKNGNGTDYPDSTNPADVRGAVKGYTFTGGAIHNGSAANLSVRDSTFYRDAAAGGTGGDGSAINNDGILVQLHNSVLDGEFASNSIVNRPGSEVRDVRNNLLQVAESELSTLGLSQMGMLGTTGFYQLSNGNIWDKDFVTATQSHFGELRNNGGPVPTLLPTLDSVVIDRGFGDRFLDQRGFPLQALSIGGDGIADIGATEVQSVTVSRWKSSVSGSQFGPDNALVFGFGFDDGQPDADGDGRSDLSGIQKEPEFLGFEFDTGRFSVGGIEEVDLLFDEIEFGAELGVDISGRFGLDLGFYANSGSVDVSHSGLIGLQVSQEGNDYHLSPALNFMAGDVYTISPRFGAYADLIVELEADVDVKAAFINSASGSFDVDFDANVPLFSMNRPEVNSDGSPLFVPDGHGNMVPVLDGEIQIAGSGLVSGIFEKLKDAEDDRGEAVRDRDRADQDLANARSAAEISAATTA